MIDSCYEYLQGGDACSEGLELDDNPYQTNTWKWLEWREGWLDTKREFQHELDSLKRSQD